MDQVRLPKAILPSRFIILTVSILHSREKSIRYTKWVTTSVMNREMRLEN